MKEIYEKINENKEKIKTEISKIFTNLRNALNGREDQLLLEVENKFNDFYFNEEFIKKSEKMQNNIKINLDKGKTMDNELNKNSEKLTFFINNCINIENNIKAIKTMKEYINKFNSVDKEMKFIPKFDDNNKILEMIKNFGEFLIETNLLEYISNLGNSLIIKNNREYNKALKNWINKDKKLKAELLYRLSKDGEKMKKFHELCDDEGPTLTLFQVNEGIGGIYTPLSWDSKSGWKCDNETFMFNLNKNEKYKKLRKDYSILCGKNYGPWTYGFGLSGKNQMKRIEHGGICINDVFDKGGEILPNELKNGSKYFEVIEIEVYKIIEIYKYMSLY